MPETLLLAFVSSTSDLVSEREAVAAALPRSFSVYRYEKDRARGASPRDRLREVLRDTDVFLGILGESYGSVYPDCEGDPSIVQWEFETARAVDGCELMAFRKASLDPARIDPRQQRFLEGLAGFEGGAWIKTYGSIPELSDEVRDSLLDWLATYRLRELERREMAPTGPGARIALTAAAVAVTGLMVWFRNALLAPQVLALMILLPVIACAFWFAYPRLAVSSAGRSPHGA